MALAVAASTLAMSTAWAADNTGSPGASSNAPGREMQQQSGRMQGPPNAAGFKGNTDTTGSTSRSGTENSTGPNDAGSGSSPGAKNLQSGK
ncbi:hypothetical protein [Methylobacterium nodulans]|uniref:hypothetical protein n=1 Tax=Methylobacterium nodulans TaxID=114616 RepID=UPI001FCA55C2|nr:hypothetical protein [Methylobacterium nodulans]